MLAKKRVAEGWCFKWEYNRPPSGPSSYHPFKLQSPVYKDPSWTLLKCSLFQNAFLGLHQLASAFSVIPQTHSHAVSHHFLPYIHHMWVCARRHPLLAGLPPSPDTMLIISVLPSPSPIQCSVYSRCSVRVCWIEASSIYTMSHHQPLESHNGYFHFFIFPLWPQNDPNQAISKKEQTPPNITNGGGVCVSKVWGREERS